MGLALSETPKAGLIASSIWVCTVCICPQNDAVCVFYIKNSRSLYYHYLCSVVEDLVSIPRFAACLTCWTV